MLTPDRSASSIQTGTAVAPEQDYARPLAIVTTLIFMWGFITSLNDILVPHLADRGQTVSAMQLLRKGLVHASITEINGSDN